MERLTNRQSYCYKSGCLRVDTGTCGIECEDKRVYDRLKAYEDTGLEPEEVHGMDLSYRELRDSLQETGIDAGLSRLRELAQADKEGRVVILPCTKNDILWTFATYPKRYVYPFKINGVEWSNGIGELHTDRIGTVRFEDVGKGVFLTSEEAEAAIKREKGERDG